MKANKNWVILHIVPDGANLTREQNGQLYKFDPFSK